MKEITITPFEISLLSSQTYAFIHSQMKLSDEEVKMILTNIIHTIDMRNNYEQNT